MALPSPAALESCSNHPDVTSGLVQCARCGNAFCADCVVELEGKPYDAACKEEQVRDLRSGIVPLEIATAGRRFGAMFIDGLVFSPLWIGLAMAYPQAKMFDNPLPRIVLPIVLWTLYEAWMLVSFKGQTLGKKAARVRVVNSDGSAVTAGQALRRAISRNLMGYTYVLGLVDSLMIYSQQRRTLHDRIGGTLVITARS